VMLSSLSIPHLMTESRGALPFRAALNKVERHVVVSGQFRHVAQ
jgi:hypothetical protein